MAKGKPAIAIAPAPTPAPDPTPTPAAAPKPRKKRVPVDKNETKEDKLLRLANQRVAKALGTIRLIGNLATYKPTEAQVAAIEEALGTACVSVISRLNGTRKESFTFTLTK